MESYDQIVERLEAKKKQTRKLGFDGLINERTYRIVLLTSFIPNLIRHGNTIISVKHFEEIRKYFRKEAELNGYSGTAAEDYIRLFINRVIGCEYTMDYYKPADGETTETGTELCYMLTADKNKTNKDFINKKNKFIINIKIINEMKFIERYEIVAQYRELVEELKQALHTNSFDIIGMNEHRYSLIDYNKDINIVGNWQIEWVSEKIAENSNYNIFAINTELNFDKKSKNWSLYDFIRDAQNRGLIY